MKCLFFLSCIAISAPAVLDRLNKVYNTMPQPAISLTHTLARTICTACVKLPPEEIAQETLDIQNDLGPEYTRHCSKLPLLNATEDEVIASIQSAIETACAYLKDRKYKEYYDSLLELYSCSNSGDRVDPTCAKPITNDTVLDLIAKFICEKYLEFKDITDPQACPTLRTVISDRHKMCLAYKCMGKK